MAEFRTLSHLPNALTWVRVACIPLLVLIHISVESHHWVAAACFAVAASTDLFDGYLARRFDATTALGEFLDPVADKLLVITALVLLIGQYGSLWLTLPGIIIVCRELMISALREWLAETGKQLRIPVSFLAKIKTGLQMVAITILLANQPNMSLAGIHPWTVIGFILIYVAAIFTIWTMCLYVQFAWKSLVGEQHSS